MKPLYKEFEPIGKSWLLDLGKYNEVPFQRKTAKTRWSISEIYEHLGTSTLNFHLAKISEALSASTSGSKTWAGKMVFFRKNFNNKKLCSYMIESHSPNAAENIAHSKDTMYKILKKMEELSGLINESNKGNKSEHPVLGHLTIVEWYKLVSLHFDYLSKTKNKIHQLLTQQ